MSGTLAPLVAMVCPGRRPRISAGSDVTIEGWRGRREWGPLRVSLKGPIPEKDPKYPNMKYLYMALGFRVGIVVRGTYLIFA